jgi:cytochrome c biogenesis protein CcdA
VVVSGVAFAAGTVATVNPCGFAMLPAFVSYLVGEPAAGEAETREAPLVVRLWRAVRVGVVVTAAFVGVFAAVGLVFAFLSRAVVEVVPWAALIVGVLLVGWGLVVLAGRARLVLRLPYLGGGGGERSSALLFGVGYAVASLSCTLPVFMAVVAGTFATRGVLASTSGFVAYAAGMGTVVLAVAISVALARHRFVGFLRRQGRHVERGSGAVLAAAGAYLTLYWGYASAPANRPWLRAARRPRWRW